ncbi:MAG: DEAD/DEAH box helicase, partial [Bdellovibrionales bacterium]|nr:DEAD/DEAH box helicase [Bdellovibrionales bacterium]
MSFEQFSLHPSLLANVAQMGFTQPTEVQQQVIPMAIEGRDVSGLSRTGTGKTAAFLIPTIHRLASMPAEKIALCLAPTRELAQQIETEARKLSVELDMKPTSIVGGMAYEDQIKAIQGGARIIAGTPGRVIDLYKSRQLDLSRVAVLVFDEADRM